MLLFFACLLPDVLGALQVATPSRRAVATGAACALLSSAPAVASRSRSAGYEVVHSDREWSYMLSPQQYNILRQGGTEPPNSSPLVKEKRAGVFRCAGCDAALFDASQKFESGTGWPSFANAERAVEVDGGNPVVTALLGSEVRCGKCGGHLGDLFLDGILFPGTPAAVSGKRYCIDGAALVFQPAEAGAPLVSGEGAFRPAGELPDWLQPPKVGAL